LPPWYAFYCRGRDHTIKLNNPTDGQEIQNSNLERWEVIPNTYSESRNNPAITAPERHHMDVWA
jgi:hypothetical protein